MNLEESFYISGEHQFAATVVSSARSRELADEAVRAPAKPLPA